MQHKLKYLILQFDRYAPIPLAVEMVLNPQQKGALLNERNAWLHAIINELSLTDKYISEVLEELESGQSIADRVQNLINLATQIKADN